MNKRGTLRYHIVFISVFAIGLLGGFLLFCLSLNKLQSSSVEQYHLKLEKCQIDIEGRIQQVETVLTQLGGNEALHSLSERQNPQEYPEEEQAFSLAVEALKSYADAVPFLEDIFIYFPANDVVVTTQQPFYCADVFHQNYYICNDHRIDGAFGQPTSASGYSILPSHEVRFEDDLASRMLFVQTVAAAGDAPDVIVAVLVKEDTFVELFGKNIASGAGDGFVWWQDVLVASTIKDKEFALLEAEKGNFTLELSQQDGGWRYSVVAPAADIYEDVGRYRITGIAILLATALCAGVLLMAFLKKRATPMWRVLDAFSYGSQGNDEPNEMVFIHTSVQNLMATNEHLQQAVQSSHSIVANAFWTDLLRGQITLPKEMSSYLEMESFATEGPFLAVAFRLCGGINPDMPDIQQCKQRLLWLDEQLQFLFEEYVHGCNAGPLAWVMVCTEHSENRQLWEKLDGVKRAFEEHFGEELGVSVGDPVPSTIELFHSFHHAMTQMHSSVFSVGLTAGSLLTYPLTVIHKLNLVRLLKTGDQEAADSYLQEALDLGDKIESSHQVKKQQYVYAMLSCLLLAYNEMKQDPDFPGNTFEENFVKVYQSDTIDHQLAQLQQLQAFFCQAARQAQENASSPLLEKVRLYIRENLFDYNLSLEMVADHLHVSRAYLSHQFKARSGVNFSTFVEKLRIEASCQYIQQGERVINTIAARVGYNSAQVYRRAFKRVMGLSPSEYIRNVEMGGGIQ